ncbi:MAG: T9SS type A sorting domain-containing protein [Balneolaceae bacterium]|nr:T9SS type A sorting domain-containing protein [Balneolaceae bacterium]
MLIRRKQTRRRLVQHLAVVLTLLPLSSVAQTTLTPSVSATALTSADSATLTLSIDTPLDLYFLGLEVMYDPSRVALDTSQVTLKGLFESGLSVVEAYEPGRVGASFSRTTPLSAAEAGDLATFSFTAVPGALPGDFTFELTNIEAVDSNNDPIAISVATLDSLTLKPGADRFEFFTLAESASQTVTEGKSILDTLFLDIQDVTTDLANASDVTVELGVVSAGENPLPQNLTSWDESAWTTLTDVSVSDSATWAYPVDVSWRLDEGAYYAAARVTAPNGTVTYTGPNGISYDYTSTENVGSLTINPYEYYTYTLAGWDFDSESLVATTATASNQGLELGLHGITLAGYVNGAGGTGRAASSRGWHTEADYEFKGWDATVALDGLVNINVTSKQTSSGSGPNTIAMIARDQNNEWLDVGGDMLMMDDNNFDVGAFNTVMPDNVIGNDTLTLRWTSVMDFRQDEEGPITTTGTNRIDDILITGVNPNANLVTVHPGDTDNDGSVGISDVLPLGVHWLTSGPAPIHEFTTFEAREVESWVSELATYADTDGNGVVNHLDLKYVGLYFGQDAGSGQAKPVGGAQADESQTDDGQAYQPSMTMMSMSRGDMQTLAIENTDEAVAGIAFELQLPEGWQNMMDIEAINPLSAEVAGSPHTDILDMTFTTDNVFYAAFVTKNPEYPQAPEYMAQIRIKALEALQNEFDVTLKSLKTISTEGVITQVEDPSEWITLQTTSTEDPSSLPSRTELLPTYPNPFNPSTNIRFALRQAGDVSIRVYNILGQEVAMLADGQAFGAGIHHMTFDAGDSGLSTGVYLIQMKTQERVFMQQVTLMK